MTAWILVLALLAGGPTPTLGGHVSRGDARNDVIMPLQRIDLTFDHALHVGEVELECTNCHEAALTSRKAKDPLVPARTYCLDCHDDEEIRGRWGQGVKAKESALELPPARIHFAHETHLRLEGVTCASCHVGVDQAKLATRDHLPSMETCLSCHDGVKAKADCLTCHLEGRAGTIRTSFGAERLRPDDHGVHWLAQHELAAERDMASCAACHAQEDCLSCHEGAVPPTFHDGDYLARHPQEALANSPVCASCHRLDSFCRDCHVRAQVTLAQPLFPSLGGTFHPAGWSDFPPLGREHHSYVARKNLSACVACHQQEDCLSCHVWYPGAPRTHPPGWANSAAMRRLRAESFATCLRCHVPADPSDPINGP